VQIILQRGKLFVITHVASVEEVFRSDDAMSGDDDDWVDGYKADASVNGSRCFFGSDWCIDAVEQCRRRLLPTKDK
jgi:hypothetical protein